MSFKLGFPGDLMVRNPPCQCRRPRFHPWVGKIPWRRPWQPTPVFSPGKSHGQRSLVGYSPWGGSQRDTTEHVHISNYLCWKTFYLSWTNAFIKYNKRNLLQKWNKHKQNTYKALFFLVMRPNKYLKFLSVYFACLFLWDLVVSDF